MSIVIPNVNHSQRLLFKIKSDAMKYPETFWNERYAVTDYIYGKAPNEFFVEQLSTLTPGRILLPAEGEGRNAVYAAKQGWDV